MKYKRVYLNEAEVEIVKSALGNHTQLDSTYNERRDISEMIDLADTMTEDAMELELRAVRG